jgi:hypothetical protein
VFTSEIFTATAFGSFKFQTISAWLTEENNTVVIVTAAQNDGTRNQWTLITAFPSAKMPCSNAASGNRPQELLQIQSPACSFTDPAIPACRATGRTKARRERRMRNRQRQPAFPKIAQNRERSDGCKTIHRAPQGGR